jgi:hypothetical protein
MGRGWSGLRACRRGREEDTQGERHDAIPMEAAERVHVEARQSVPASLMGVVVQLVAS